TLFSILCILSSVPTSLFSFFSTSTATTDIYTLSLHDALPICLGFAFAFLAFNCFSKLDCATSLSDEFSVPPTHSSMLPPPASYRSEEHTSELQSRENLVCRLLLEKKKKQKHSKKMKVKK